MPHAAGLGGSARAAAKRRKRVEGKAASKAKAEAPQLPEGTPKLFDLYFRNAGLSRPTEVQRLLWAAAAGGRDVVARAPTGSGKTLAFLLPAAAAVMQRAASAPGAPPAVLVVAPTRELAAQIAGVAAPLARLAGLATQCVFGGIDIAQQAEALAAGCAILVGTVGRLLDLHRRKALKLGRVRVVVLDEADKMLSMGLKEQMDALMAALPRQRDRQTVLTSATLPPAVREAAARWVREPKEVGVARDTSVGANGVANTSIAEGDAAGDAEPDVVAGAVTAEGLSQLSATLKQHVHVCAPHKRERLVLRFLSSLRDNEKSSGARSRARVLIFVNTVKAARAIASMVRRGGKEKLSVLFGEMAQSERTRSLESFRAGRTPVLVATDVAARGLDIAGLEYVFMYDFPPSLEQYVHRAGRAGRAGRPGECFALFTRNFAPLARDLVAMLEASGQRVEAELQRVADETPEGAGRRARKEKERAKAEAAAMSAAGDAIPEGGVASNGAPKPADKEANGSAAGVAAAEEEAEAGDMEEDKPAALAGELAEDNVEDLDISAGLVNSEQVALALAERHAARMSIVRTAALRGHKRFSTLLARAVISADSLRRAHS